MINTTRISHEIKDVIDRHLEELKPYLPLPEPLAGSVPEDIVSLLERLSVICDRPAPLIPCQIYEEAHFARLRIEEFLKVMNYDMDSNVDNSEIGRIMASAGGWLTSVKSQTSERAVNDIWDFIAPVKPDHLEHLGNGVYEAKWWRPVPMMDVEILQRTNGLAVHGTPSEPISLPGGIAVRFSLVPCSGTRDTR